MSIITKVMVGAITALVLVVPLTSTAGPDGAQRAIIEKAQQAKRELAAAQAASGAER